MAGVSVNLLIKDERIWYSLSVVMLCDEEDYILTRDSVVGDKSPIPPPGKSEDEDALILQDYPYIDGPVKVDYGTNLRYSQANPSSDICSHFLDLAKEFMSTSTAPSSTPAQ